MFESLKHWFDSLQDGSKLFDHRHDEVLHSALASVLFHIISANQHVAVREKRMFADILKQECDLNDEQIDYLYQAASQSVSDWHEDLHTINVFLKQNPGMRMNFMKKLIRLIDVDGVQDGELEAFYETLHEVFPEVKQL
ncbi:MAG: hypothetical protein GY763_14260 [Gammaproteobacteria bacterium]|nr:hypothetical protein [Gammaproteobacteria bacterium]